MEINVHDRQVEIKGNIKTLENYMTIKEVVQSMVDRGADSITFIIEDSLSMTSSVIGYLMKLVNVDRIHIHMYIGDDRLIDLMEELSLVQVFGVKKLRG
ncbi:hypothetical protein ADMFC3_11050 [Geovibrio sp. ADMFC3]|jgi:hypothetical protein|nr:hypothetical protein [Deferribacteraceae bacterium]